MAGHKRGGKSPGRKHHGKKGAGNTSLAILEHQEHRKILVEIKGHDARVVTAHLRGFHLNSYTRRWLEAGRDLA
jgi:hypothetical protein